MVESGSVDSIPTVLLCLYWYDCFARINLILKLRIATSSRGRDSSVVFRQQLP